jgi:hypothetical protein
MAVPRQLMIVFLAALLAAAAARAADDVRKPATALLMAVNDSGKTVKFTAAEHP